MSDSAHSGSVASLSLATLLIDLLNEHVAKEAAFSEAMRDYAETVAARSDEEAGDPPTWEQTNWDKAVRWLSQRSAFFLGMNPESVIYEQPLTAYGMLLRHHIVCTKSDSVIQGSPVAAELLEFERSGFTDELREYLKLIPPANSISPLVPNTIDDGHLTHIELADRYGLAREACRKRLDRWRSKHLEGWHESANATGRQPKYLYQHSAVKHLFE